MSGRETVRSFREAGGFVAAPPPPQRNWLRTALFAVALLAAGGGAFLAVVYLLPIVPQLAVGAMDAPVGLSFSAIKAQSDRVDASRKIIVSIKGASLTAAENKLCGNAWTSARTAAVTRERNKRELSGSHFEDYSADAAGQAARIACEAATRPQHLCDTSQRDSFIFDIQAQSEDYDRSQKLVNMSDDELLAAKKKYPALSPIALPTLRQDLNDMNAATTKSLEDTRGVIRSLTASGVISTDAFRAANGYGALWSTYMKMIDGANDGPSACPKA